jgi:hypothetical protein
MSLRDYFAAAAMQGLLANIDTTSGKAQLAKSCYALADAMLAERAREKEEAQK